MEKISSFKLDHNTHGVGFYLSSVNKDIFTYDLRFKRPNCKEYISPSAAHTIEHLFATVIRNKLKDEVIYFGPMGCRTGFYLLLRNISLENAKTYVLSAIADCLALNKVPGGKKIECGNYRSHCLKSAKIELAEYAAALSCKN